MIKNFIACMLTASILLTNESCASSSHDLESLENLGTSTLKVVKTIDENYVQGWKNIQKGAVQIASGISILYVVNELFGLKSRSDLEKCSRVYQSNAHNNKLASDAIAYTYVGNNTCLSIFGNHVGEYLQSNYPYTTGIWIGGSLIFKGLWDLGKGVHHLGRSVRNIYGLGSDVYKDKNS